MRRGGRGVSRCLQAPFCVGCELFARLQPAANRVIQVNQRPWHDQGCGADVAKVFFFTSRAVVCCDDGVCAVSRFITKARERRVHDLVRATEPPSGLAVGSVQVHDELAVLLGIDSPSEGMVTDAPAATSKGSAAFSTTTHTPLPPTLPMLLSAR